MKLTDVFERVVVLNLPYKPERRARLHANLVTTGIVDSEKVVWQKAISGDWMNPPAWWNAGNGAWGCCQSHIAAVQIAAVDQIESVLILEDDAIFDPRSPDLLATIKKDWPDEWGQIYLGGQHLAETKSVSKHWLRPGNVNRTHAYALHKSAYSKFAAHCQYAPDYISRSGWHIDHQLGIAHARKDWPVLAPKWWLAGQAAGDSNVSGKVNREQWWQPIPETYTPPIVILPADLTNTDPLYLDYCHAGHNLYRSTCEDVGADKALNEGGGLHRFLDSVSGEAVWHHRIPSIQHPEFTRKLLKARKWQGKVIEPTANELPDIHASLMEELTHEVWK